uniref:Uncharacterized protein n=1 Tax=Arundo donax TaxID=35708 RepID=A0A0A9CIZ1_ARUDO
MNPTTSETTDTSAPYFATSLCTWITTSFSFQLPAP